LFGKTVENAYMTDILQAVIDSGGLVASVPVYSDWVEVDTVKDLNLKIVSDRLKGIYHE
jgi:NDP-sugar pyrophosphorylase family protein